MGSNKMFLPRKLSLKQQILETASSKNKRIEDNSEDSIENSPTARNSDSY